MDDASAEKHNEVWLLLGLETHCYRRMIPRLVPRRLLRTLLKCTSDFPKFSSMFYASGFPLEEIELKLARSKRLLVAKSPPTRSQSLLRLGRRLGSSRS